MCRLAAWAGSPTPLSTLLYAQPRALQELAYDPREQLSGSVNTDGTGIVWFPPLGGAAGTADPSDRTPLQYRTSRTPWADPNLPGLAPRLTSHVILASVRSATEGIGFGEDLIHPFVAGALAGTHNGFISEFRSRVARPLTAELSDEAFALLPGLSDSAALFLLAWDAHRAGASLAEAARHAAERTAKVCQAQGATATLTLVLADDSGVGVVNAATGRPANSLYLRSDAGLGGHLLASEPMDPAGDWAPVPAGATVALTPHTDPVLTPAATDSAPIQEPTP